MEVFCDYCGAKLDIEHEKRCPNCGAPFDDNEGVKAYREEKARKEEHQRQVELLRLHQQERQNNAANANQTKPVQPAPVVQPQSKKSCTTRIISMIIFFVVIILPTMSVIVNKVSKTGSSGSSTSRAAITAVPVTVKPAEKNVSVAFGETAQTNDYSIVCDEVYKTDISYYTPSEGYMYVAFHFKAKNTGISKLWLTSDMSCLVDDTLCNIIWNMDLKEFSGGNLPAGVSTEGYKCYMVPVDAKSVTITYGDYVRMEISLAGIEDKTKKTERTPMTTVATVAPAANGN